MENRTAVVSVNIHGTWFHKSCDNEAETFETVSAIMETNRIMFPQIGKAKSAYMSMIVEAFKTGEFNHALPEMFKITFIEG